MSAPPMPAVSRQDRRTTHPRGLLVVFGLLVLVLGACSFRVTEPDAYGDTTRDGFIGESAEETEDEVGTGCIGQLERSADQEAAGAASQICTCAYEGISDEETGIPFEEFEQLDDELGTGDDNNSKSLDDEDLGPPAARAQQIISNCRSSLGESFSG